MIFTKRKFFLIVFGSSLEYYDFVLYGLLANYIGKTFFPTSNNTIHLIQSFSIFALGYLIRPISGTLLGLIADKFSKIKVFSFSILLMGLSTLTIGIIPSYEKVGIMAPLLLVLARLLQGVSFASELPGAVTIISDSYFKKYIPVATSIGYLMASTGVGFILASLIVFILHTFLTPSQIENWGWRLPFILGGALAFISYFVRRSLEATEEFKELSEISTKNAIISFFKNVFISNHMLILRGVSITSLMASGTIFFMYLPHLLEHNFSFTPQEIHMSFLIGLITFTICCAFFGHLLKQIGVEKVFIGTAATLPFMLYALVLLIKFSQSKVVLILFFIVYEIYMAALYVSGLRILSQLFLPSLKNTSISFCYNISFSIFSFFPVIITYLISITNFIESFCFLFFIPSVAAVISVYVDKGAKA